MAGQRTRSGDDANAEVLLELLEEDEGENCVRDQADPCGDETLRQQQKDIMSSTLDRSV